METINDVQNETKEVEEQVISVISVNGMMRTKLEEFFSSSSSETEETKHLKDIFEDITADILHEMILEYQKWMVDNEEYSLKKYVVFSMNGYGKLGGIGEVEAINSDFAKMLFSEGMIYLEMVIDNIVNFMDEPSEIDLSQTLFEFISDTFSLLNDSGFDWNPEDKFVNYALSSELKEEEHKNIITDIYNSLDLYEYENQMVLMDLYEKLFMSIYDDLDYSNWVEMIRNFWEHTNKKTIEHIDSDEEED